MKYFIICLLIITFGFSQVSANEIIKDSNSVIFKNSEISLRVQVFTSNIVKFSFRSKDDTSQINSYVTVLSPENNIYSFGEDTDNYYIYTDSLVVSVLKAGLYPKVRYKDEVLCEYIKYVNRESHQAITYTIDTNELFYGFGSHAIPIERSKVEFTLYNTSKFGYQNNVMNLSAGVPLFISSKMYAVYGDNYGQNIVGMNTLDTNLFKYVIFTGKMDFFVIKGHSYSDILTNYCKLTGFQDLPPLWAFGFLQSKSTFHSKEEVFSLVKKFKENKFPLDAIILDLAWFYKEKKIGDYFWQTESWGNPEEYVKELNIQGIKTVLITEPYIAKTADNHKVASDSGFLVKDKDGNLPSMTVLHAETSLLDLTDEKAQNWFWNNLKSLSIDAKIDGWWCDLGEPEIHPAQCLHKIGTAQEVHNIYSNLWGKSIYNNWKNDLPDKRLFLLFRSGWAGMQGFSMIPWSGDITRSYSSLKSQIQINLGMGMSGVGYMHSDCGGFYGPNTDEQLYTRWVEYSSFTPILRVHFVGNVSNEPVNYPDYIQTICKKYVNLRYSLLPYIYTLAYENSTLGIPLCRQMNFYNNDRRLSNENEQYFFGKDIIVAPVLDSVFTKTVKFPDGNWIDYHTLNQYNGYSEHEFDAPLEILPLFIRAGAIIPSVEPIMSTSEYKTDTLTLNYYFHFDVANSTAKIFIDDAVSLNTIKNGEFEILSVKADYKDSLITLDINRELNNWTKYDTNRVYKINIINKDLSKAIVYQNTNTTVNKLLYTSENPERGFSFISEKISGSVKFDIKLNYFDSSVIDYDNNIFTFYPNPVDNILNIQLFTKEYFRYIIEIYNLEARQIFNTQNIILDVGNVTIQLNIDKLHGKSLNKGMYILKFKSKNINKNFNFIVN